MRIGIDFDNTLAIYDRVFTMLAKKYGYLEIEENLTKEKIKQNILKIEGGDIKWQMLQGQAYGRFMSFADIANGAENFLLRSKLRGHDVFIVSHKTKFGHFDESLTPLRLEALKWMDEKKFFSPEKFGINKDNVFFLDTREEKVLKIAELNCDYFVDDLKEVLIDISFPNAPKKILYSPHGSCNDSDFLSISNWDDIGSTVLGDEGIDDIGVYAAALLDGAVQNIVKLEGRGNSAIFRVQTSLGEVSLKRYPHSLSPTGVCYESRLGSEINACEFLEKNKFENIRHLKAYSTELNVAVFDWIEGQDIKSISNSDILMASQFVASLYSLSKNKTAQSLKNAKEACFSTSDIITQITNREKLLAATALENLELRDFFLTEYYPLRNVIFEFVKKNKLWDDREVVLGRDFQTLSPSDFGFHNAIKGLDDNIYWLDFEYFGWDDPVKLVSDFIWHPAMSLTEDQKNIWLKQAFQIFGHIKFFEDRLKMHHLIFGLRWILIILNPFSENFWKEKGRILQFKSINKNNLLSERLSAAKKIASQISYEYFSKCNPSH